MYLEGEVVLSMLTREYTKLETPEDRLAAEELEAKRQEELLAREEARRKIDKQQAKKIPLR